MSDRHDQASGAGQQPLVSIVLTTLNAARYLRESIDSCLAQTYGQLELIVVDGGSTDGTLEIVQSYADPRLRLIHQPDNVGKLPGALNLGLDHACGEYLTWMQADSLYHPKAIATMVRELDAHPEVGHVYADYWQIDAAGAVERVVETGEPDQILGAKDDLCGVCFLLRRSAREAVGPHDVRAYPTQDYDYRQRLAMRVASRRIREPLYYWRLHPHSLTGSRPWTIDKRNDVQIRLRLGVSTLAEARRDLAAIDIAYAFDRYHQHHRSEVPGLICSGVAGDPRHLLNRGVWSILLRSAPAVVGRRLGAALGVRKGLRNAQS